MKMWCDSRADGHFVLGSVQYMTTDEIRGRIGRILASEDGAHFFKTVQGRGDSLLWKRDYFGHEQEVRAIYISTKESPPTEAFQLMHFDPNTLFTEISFDPRLATFERKEREAELGRVGYRGRVLEDRSYSKELTVIAVPSWRPP